MVQDQQHGSTQTPTYFKDMLDEHFMALVYGSTDNEFTLEILKDKEKTFRYIKLKISAKRQHQKVYTLFQNGGK